MDVLVIYVQWIALAFEAIRGHRSAHSLATGPLIAEPGKWYNNFNWSQFKNWRRDRTFHFSFVVDNDPRVILKVEDHAVLPSVGFPLSHHDSSHHLLSKFWLSFLDCDNSHITNSGSRQSVEASTDAMDGDDIQVFGAWKQSLHDNQFLKFIFKIENAYRVQPRFNDNP